MRHDSTNASARVFLRAISECPNSARAEGGRPGVVPTVPANGATCGTPHDRPRGRTHSLRVTLLRVQPLPSLTTLPTAALTAAPGAHTPPRVSGCPLYGGYGILPCVSNVTSASHDPRLRNPELSSFLVRRTHTQMSKVAYPPCPVLPSILQPAFEKNDFGR